MPSNFRLDLGLGSREGEKGIQILVLLLHLDFRTCMQPDIVLHNSGTSIAPPARVDTIPAALEFGFGD